MNRVPSLGAVSIGCQFIAHLPEQALSCLGCGHIHIRNDLAACRSAGQGQILFYVAAGSYLSSFFPFRASCAYRFNL
jgi:hypothetical protein